MEEVPRVILGFAVTFFAISLSFLEREVFGCSPLEEELVCFDVDFLEEAVVDPADFWSVHFAEICGEYFVDGEESCVVAGDLEFVKVAVQAIGAVDFVYFLVVGV